MVTIKYGEGTANPTTTLAAENYVVLDAMGRVLLKDSAFEVLPAGAQNLKITADYMDRTPLMSAEVVKGLADALGCLDTVQGTLINGASTWGQIGFQTYGHTSYTYYDVGEGGNPYPYGVWLGNGTPNTRGLTQLSLPITSGDFGIEQFKTPNLRNFAKYELEIDAGNVKAETYSPPFTLVIGAERQATAIAGVAGGALWDIDWTLFRHLPKGAVIERALLEVEPVGDITVQIQSWDERAEGMGTEGIPLATTEYELPNVGFGIVGYDPAIGDSGAWDSLGSFVETNSGTIYPYQRSVINVTSTISALNGLRTSGGRYSRICLHLATANGVASPTPTATSAYNFGLVENLITGWSSRGVTQDGYELDGWTPKYLSYGYAKQFISNASFLFGTLAVQFSVPQAALDAYRFQYGNMPPMG